MEVFWYAETDDGQEWGNRISFTDPEEVTLALDLLKWNLIETLKTLKVVFTYITLQVGSMAEFRTDREGN